MLPAPRGRAGWVTWRGDRPGIPKVSTDAARRPGDRRAEPAAGAGPAAAVQRLTSRWCPRPSGRSAAGPGDGSRRGAPAAGCPGRHSVAAPVGLRHPGREVTRRSRTVSSDHPGRRRHPSTLDNQARVLQGVFRRSSSAVLGARTRPPPCVRWLTVATLTAPCRSALHQNLGSPWLLFLRRWFPGRAVRVAADPGAADRVHRRSRVHLAPGALSVDPYFLRALRNTCCSSCAWYRYSCARGRVALLMQPRPRFIGAHSNLWTVPLACLSCRRAGLAVHLRPTRLPQLVLVSWGLSETGWHG